MSRTPTTTSPPFRHPVEDQGVGAPRTAADQLMMTTFVFRVHNIPAALYKAMGGFATNGVNMTKLESYQLGGTFFATQFYADIEGHPEDPHVAQAMKELGFFSPRIRCCVFWASTRRPSLPLTEQPTDKE